MLLEWIELTDDLNLVHRKRQDVEINTNSVCQYARRNCKKCYGRGYLDFSLGKGYTFYEQSLRRMTCDCVDRQLAKLDDLNVRN